MQYEKFWKKFDKLVNNQYRYLKNYTTSAHTLPIPHNVYNKIIWVRIGNRLKNLLKHSIDSF